MLAPDMDPAIGDTLRSAQGISRVLRRLRRLGLVRRVGGVPIDLWDAFRAVSMPCLLLRGALSDVLPTHLVAQMQAVKPDLQVAEIPNRGHAPLLNEPEARAALEEFLARF
jgi:pimeloyl-ACP methyl ester carboxylesterase